MRKKNLFEFSVILMCVVSMFATSCVQGDFFDELYDDSEEWSLPRNKRGKDYYDPQAMQDLSNKIMAGIWANTQDFDSDQSECLACALYNYSVEKNMNKTRYQMREYVGRAAYGSNWQYRYFLDVTQGPGVYLSDAVVDAVIYDAVGASNHTSSKEDLKPKYFTSSKNYHNDVIIEIEKNNKYHFGVLQRVYQNNNNFTWYIWIKDQAGDGQVFEFSKIIGVWY